MTGGSVVGNPEDNRSGRGKIPVPFPPGPFGQANEFWIGHSSPVGVGVRSESGFDPGSRSSESPRRMNISYKKWPLNGTPPFPTGHTWRGPTSGLGILW